MCYFYSLMEIKKEYKPDCRLFDGYKPCIHKRKNCTGCRHYQKRGTMILLIHREAMGAVLMSTAILPALKRKYPKSYLIWVTESPSIPLLENNPLIDRVMPFDFNTFMALKNIRFDLVLNADKSQISAGFAMEMNGTKKMGFRMGPSGALMPFNREAQYNYRLGLDDDLKFRKNRKSVPQYTAETFGLVYKKDGYILNLSREQKDFIEEYSKKTGLGPRDLVVGFNTGCSELYKNKKLEVGHILSLIKRIHQNHPDVKIALFGGKSETERNERIVREAGFPLINTPTTKGLRTGIAVMDIADVIVTGDTLGLHIGIGLKKRIVAWFNVSCSQEIELFGRGEKIASGAECSPCWKRECSSLVCFEKIELDRIYEAIEREIGKAKKDKDPHYPS